jgi:hypothetical protein
MKLLPVILLLLAAQADAQLVQFADTTGRWFVADTYPNGSMQDPGFTATLTTTIFYQGDTLLGLEPWSVMMAWPSAGNIGTPEPIGHARTVGDMVLFRDTMGVVDTLYDFSLQPGDSVFYPEPIGAYLHVDQVTSVLVAEVPHRIIEFESFLEQIPSFFHERWMEGIGSVHGPLFPRYPRNFMTEVPGDSLRLTCYERDDTLLWSHPGYTDCVVNILQALGDRQSRDGSVHIWPNPGSHEFQVTWERTAIRAVILSDPQGRVVLQHALDEASGSLDTSALATGLYTVLVIGRDGARTTQQWIKQ